ncbi:response regulator transcription factor [Mucilaginibacter pedocola]|uniref:DNA-binding response regulator n=1 Tax=Mucilaginibacter pedocola TaxID=1792845 RepID=A0A1S9PFC3_9SPHI|nr:response regulator transcription factor [Mucilaginibacter pedocola]OOQ59656.1 DNA-binding response regulator [Mucilaginibacter pedocola]
MKVLVLEDNPQLGASIREFLTREGYLCEVADTYAKAKDKILSSGYDLILLDIMLPDGNGLDLLRIIKQENIASGVLIISAKEALDDKIRGLEGGADDYITKPFHLSELHARLRAIYRRKNPAGSSGSIISFNEISLNTDTLEAFINNQLLDITRKEFDLLMYFVVNKNRVLSKQAIATHLWGDYTDNLDNLDFVYQHVKNLRRKIAQLNGTDYIDTVYGLGYRFKATEAAI